MESNKRIRGDYQEFVSAPRIPVPAALSEAVTNRIASELNPSSASVFLKLAGIQAFVGTATLAVCPQFGHSFTADMGLMPYLMRFGDSVCMLGCGALFTGLSLLVASLVLRPEEVKVLRRQRVLQIASVATLSLGAFLCLGSEIVAALGMAWILGGVLGGAGSLQLGWSVRKSVAVGAL
jgi:hypothetical protein